MIKQPKKKIIGDCQLYLGDNRIVLCDSFPLGKIDAIVTDPPYGLGKKLEGGTWGKKYGAMYEWDTIPADISFLPPLPSIIWGGNYFMLPPSRCWLVWFKRDAVRTMANCELAWTNIDSNSKTFDWTIAATNAERVNHPTQKPVELMKWCLSFIPQENIICDPFMGSGSTGVACVKTGKKFIGIERDEEYFELSCQRIEDAYRQGDMFHQMAGAIE